MDELIKAYIKELHKIEYTGISTEMSYYCPLKILIDKVAMKYLEKDIISIIEAKPRKFGELILSNTFTEFTENDKIPIINIKSQNFAKPDITVLDNTYTPIGYIEAKKISENLNKKEKIIKDYCKIMDNLIFTNFYDFILYNNGKIIKKASVTNPVSIMSDTTDNVIKLLCMFLSNSKNTQTKDFIYYE